MSSSLTIDTDVVPRYSGRWEVQCHRGMGKIEFDPDKLRLWEPKDRILEDGLLGYELIYATEGRAMNACVLDWLMEYRYMIPIDWKMYYGIVFCGTTVFNYRRRPCFFMLSWSREGGGAWTVLSRELDCLFDKTTPVLITT